MRKKAAGKKALGKFYRVEMTGLATVRGSLVLAAGSEQEARDLAAEMLGDVSWQYDGLDKLLDEHTVVELEGKR